MAKAGPVLEEMLSQGQILPSWVTVTLMKEEMNRIAKTIAESAKTNPNYCGGVLIDGFPRSIENLENFESIIGVARRLIIITCDNEAMVKRVLSRGANGGREDDQQEETVRKRLAVFNSQTQSVFGKYTLTESSAEALEKKDDTRIGIKVNGDRPVPEVSVDFVDAFVTLTSQL
jgi:adenylate kinase family enzyme